MSTSTLARPATAAGFDIYCGIDVARETHHVVALDPGGRRLVYRPLPNSEPELVALFDELKARGRVLVVVDQLASIGALAVTVARFRGVTVGYLPGLSMRRIADLYPGEAKTDARDAYVSADAGRTLPHTLRRVAAEERTTVQLSVLAGYDADLATELTRLTNRLHALLHVHPALERLLGSQFRSPGSPAAAGRHRHLGRDRRAGAGTVEEDDRGRLTADRRRLTGEILTALGEQTVVIPATEQYGQVIRGLAGRLLDVLAQREALTAQLEELLVARPLAEILISMPGVGPRTAIEWLRRRRWVYPPQRSPRRVLRGLVPPHSPACATPRAALTTTANEPRVRTTPRP